MSDYFVNQIELPGNGVFIGSGVYPHRGANIHCGGRCFSYWCSPDAPGHDVIVKLCQEENQGNLLQFWASGEDLWKLMQEATDAGLYSIAFYAYADEEISRKFKTLGKFYLQRLDDRRCPIRRSVINN